MKIDAGHIGVVLTPAILTLSYRHPDFHIPGGIWTIIAVGAALYLLLKPSKRAREKDEEWKNQLYAELSSDTLEDPAPHEHLR